MPVKAIQDRDEMCIAVSIINITILFTDTIPTIIFPRRFHFIPLILMTAHNCIGLPSNQTYTNRSFSFSRDFFSAFIFTLRSSQSKGM